MNWDSVIGAVSVIAGFLAGAYIQRKAREQTHRHDIERIVAQARALHSLAPDREGGAKPPATQNAPTN